jgi:cytoplasmic iron level regulating protein YaaA (DUF328/UPF0246 family)
MKILFSPSETKSDITNEEPINKNSYCFKNLFNKRLEVIEKYQHILDTKNIENLKKIFGIKDINKCLKLSNIDIKLSPTCKAIQRYTGVAYDYLKYNELPEIHQKYIDDNVIIFSNLFGPVFAKDSIPIYKLKQGSTLEGFKTEKFYKEHFSGKLDEMLKDEFIIDLRAGFYEKFYKISLPYITMKFIKNGKVVSHWAKAYRGIVLRQLAIDNITSLEEFKNMEIDNLKIQEIHQKGLKTEFIYNIST